MRPSLYPVFFILLSYHSLLAQNTSCVYFDGVNDRVNMGTSNSFNITGNLTLEAWVKVDIFQPNPNYSRIIDKFSFVERKGYNLILNNGHLFMEFFSPDGGSHVANSNANIQDGEWHHVAGVFSTDEINLYIDGVLDITKFVGVQTISPSSNNLGIGNNFDGQAFLPLHGLIEEVRIWNIARTAEQINGHQHICLTGNEPGLVGYWRFDDNTGIIADDLTPGNHNGTLENGALWISNDLPAFTCIPLDLDIAGTDGTCGLPNGSASATASGGFEPYAYLWSNGATTSAISDLESATYQVTVTDGDGIFLTESVVILNVDPVAPNASSTDESALNANDGMASTIPTGGTPPYTFLWSNGADEATIINLPPDLYTVTVTDSQGCAVSQSVTVHEFVCPDLQIVSLLSDAHCFGVCDGSIQIMEVLQGTAPFTFIWSNGLAGEIASDLCSGDYSVTIIDALGCSVLGTYTLHEPDSLSINANSTSETAQGANDGSASAAPLGGTPPYFYLWNTGSTDSLITNLMPGTYHVTVTDANDCAGAQSVIVNPYTCAGIIESASTNPTCFGSCDGSAMVSILGGIGPISYEWNTGDTTNTISNLCEGTYHITITDEGENCISTEVIELLDPDSLGIFIDQVIPYSDISAGAILITPFGGTPPYLYNWTGPNGFTSGDEDLSGLVPGFYVVTVTDTNGCLITVAPVEIKDETVSTARLIHLDVRLFPNPAKDYLYIDIEDITGFRMELRSIDGRVVKSWQEENIMDVSSIPSGIYLLEGISALNLFCQRLVIAR